MARAEWGANGQVAPARAVTGRSGALQVGSVWHMPAGGAHCERPPKGCLRRRYFQQKNKGFLMFSPCHVGGAEWSVSSLSMLNGTRYVFRISSARIFLGQKPGSCFARRQATGPRALWVDSARKWPGRARASFRALLVLDYFSGINPRGLNRRTNNRTNPMVSNRICATLSSRCSFNADPSVSG